VAIGSDVNHIISILERCAARIIEWSSRQELQFYNAKTEVTQCIRRRGHRKHLRAKLTAKISIGKGVKHFNTEAIRSMSIWMDTHRPSKEQQNRCWKRTRAIYQRL
jgi:hypothetical protein